MPLNNAAMLVGATAIKNAMGYMQLHNGDPGDSYTANVTSAAREAISWTTPTNDGDFDLADSVDFTGITPNQAVPWVTCWSALNGGTCYGKFELVGDTTANSIGEFSVTALPFNGSAS